MRAGLNNEEKAGTAARRETLNALASPTDADAKGSCDATRMQKLAAAMRDLVGTVP